MALMRCGLRWAGGDANEFTGPFFGVEAKRWRPAQKSNTFFMPIGGPTMRYLALLLVLSGCAAIQPQPATPRVLHTLKQDQITIMLLDAPCVDPTSVRMIRAEKLASFRAIDSIWPEKDGSLKRYAGCWLELKAGDGVPQDMFFMVFSDGEYASVPTYMKLPDA